VAKRFHEPFVSAETLIANPPAKLRQLPQSKHESAPLLGPVRQHGVCPGGSARPSDEALHKTRPHIRKRNASSFFDHNPRSPAKITSQLRVALLTGDDTTPPPLFVLWFRVSCAREILIGQHAEMDAQSFVQRTKGRNF